MSVRFNPCSLVLILFLQNFFLQVLAKDYSYNDQQSWPGLCQTGQRQTPININTNNLSPLSGASVQFTNFDIPMRNFDVINDGFSIEIRTPNDIERSISLRIGETQETYIFVQLHFHWANLAVGAEHLVNGKRSSVEAHFVCFNSKYGTFDAALNNADGLLVFGVFLDPTIKGNLKPSDLFNVLKNAPKPGETIKFRDELDFKEFMPSLSGGSSLATYGGSLTTPPCLEVVTWLVNLEPVRLPSKIFKAFWLVKREEKRNFREIQPINSRVIRRIDL